MPWHPEGCAPVSRDALLSSPCLVDRRSPDGGVASPLKKRLVDADPVAQVRDRARPDRCGSPRPPAAAALDVEVHACAGPAMSAATAASTAVVENHRRGCRCRSSPVSSSTVRPWAGTLGGRDCRVVTTDDTGCVTLVTHGMAALRGDPGRGRARSARARAPQHVSSRRGRLPPPRPGGRRRTSSSKGRFDVRITTPHGDVVALAIRGPGETFGELAVVTEDGAQRHGHRARARRDARRPRRRSSAGSRAARVAGRGARALLAERVAFLSERLVEAYTVDAETRVARRVLELGRVYGGSPPIVIPLIQDDLAALAGTSRATVNRVLREAGAARAGRARTGRTVLDPEGLARLARVAPQTPRRRAPGPRPCARPVRRAGPARPPREAIEVACQPLPEGAVAEAGVVEHQSVSAPSSSGSSVHAVRVCRRGNGQCADPRRVPGVTSGSDQSPRRTTRRRPRAARRRAHEPAFEAEARRERLPDTASGGWRRTRSKRAVLVARRRRRPDRCIGSSRIAPSSRWRSSASRRGSQNALIDVARRRRPSSGRGRAIAALLRARTDAYQPASRARGGGARSRAARS